MTMPETVASPPLLVEQSGGVTRLTLNRPDKLNAFNGAMHLALRAGLAQAAADPACRVIVLSGAGRAFSAGQDLAEGVYNPDGPQPDIGATIETYYNPLIRQMRALPKPIIAAVNGLAAGAGANIALAADIVIATKSAGFLQAFARIGLIPDAGGSYVLPRLVGQARARGMALLAEPVSAEQAQAWGMIWKAVDDTAFAAEVGAVAAKLAAAPTHALGLIKQALDASAGNTLDQQLDLERDLQRTAAWAPDYAEGVAAFMAKRKPDFKGQA
jgi:2-(1,2-epoxy-1,2-dihydrophenyl)acetyl-CoA isomerase